MNFILALKQLLQSHHVILLVPENVFHPDLKHYKLLVHRIMHLDAYLFQALVNSELFGLVIVYIVLLYQVL